MASLLGKMPTESVPVYLSGPKGRGGRELWVRAGNSTQRLEIDDAITYVSQRWPHDSRRPHRLGRVLRVIGARAVQQAEGRSRRDR